MLRCLRRTYDPAGGGLQHCRRPEPSRSAIGRTAPLPRLSRPCGPLQPRPDAGVPRLSRDGFFFPLLRNPPVAGARLSRWQQGPWCWVHHDHLWPPRGGRPVKKPRFIPAELAHQWARKLQARSLSTVSVLW